MFEHGIDVAKGWFEPAALDFAAKLSANVTFVVPAGRVVHVNSAGEFEMGVADTDMGIVLIQGSEAYDVQNAGTTPSGLFMHRAIAPTGVMSGLVCNGAYEIESTEFDTAQTYVPQELLTAGASNSVLATGGVLTNAGTGAGGDVEQYSDPVCGVVSRGSFTNAHGVEVLAFWPEWLPAAYTTEFLFLHSVRAGLQDEDPNP
jgi:hypothetical protein